MLFPDLLPVQQPALDGYSWEDAAHHIVRYNFLPRSIFPRLMVRLHKELVEGLSWRSGMVLVNERFSSTALVKVDYEDRRLEMMLSGEHTREHLSIIRYMLNEIHESFEELQFEERVPCICGECLRGKQRHYYNLEMLLRRFDRGKSTVECERSIAEVPLDRLLWGLQPAAGRTAGPCTAFISYSRADFAVVQELALDLRQHGVSYWLDNERIPPGGSISKGIEQGLEASSAILVCLSENQLSSDWSRIEWAGSLTRKRIIPLILDDLDVERIPPTMRDYLAVRRQDQQAYSALLDDLRRQKA